MVDLPKIASTYQKHSILQLLKKRLAPTARVLRDGKWISLASNKLVPGDIVRIRLGEIVPADLKLTDGDFIQVDESSLTGESLPVGKRVSEIAFSGSIVRQGERNALVFATGANTYLGHAAKLVESAKTQSHFQKAVVKIGDYLIILAAALVALQLAKKEAIVSRLAAIEEMAGVDVLCSDKTGTITQNAITVSEVVPQEGFSEKDVLRSFLSINSR